MKYPYIMSNRSFTVFIDGQTYQTDRSNPSWDKIKELINDSNPDKDELIRLVKPITAVEDAVVDIKEVTVRNGSVYYGDERVHDNLNARMLDIMSEGISLDPWVKFCQNIYANPRILARQELYDFLEKSDMPITSDGCFLAYKMVSNTYRDLYSGRFDNSVGKRVEIPRTDVDDDRQRTCSYGLHFCSKGYLNSYTKGYRVMIVKVNPKDVVAIPVDYNFAKGRTCGYDVVGEMPAAEANQYTWSAVNDYENVQWDEYDENDHYRTYN